MYEIFQNLLDSKGVTAYKVAKETGISTATLTQWKNGTSTPKTDKMQKIANYFGVSLDYLMGRNFIENMGHIIQEERIEQELSKEELALNSKISIEDIILYESDDEPIREDIFENIATALGTSYLELLAKYDLYDEYTSPYFNGDVIGYENFKKAREKYALAENAESAEDILLISRAAKKMTPENRKKLIEMAKIMFAEDFND